MHLTTGDFKSADRIEFWQDIVCRNLLEGDCVTEEDAFHGEIVAARTAEIGLSRVAAARQRYERTPRHVRLGNGEYVLLLLQLGGPGILMQDDRTAELRRGQFGFADSTRPWSLDFAHDFEQLVVHLPRSRIERAFGRTEHVTARLCETATGAFVTPFLRQLAARIDALPPVSAERLSQIAVDLIMAALGEMCEPDVRDASWTRTALRHRAETFIKSHACEPELSPATVAAALGISLRYLQTLFHGDEWGPSGLIWRCRLDMAQRDLRDPCLAARTIGDIALANGFADFAHFSRRFKAAFGATPRDYRRAAQSRQAA